MWTSQEGRVPRALVAVLLVAAVAADGGGPGVPTAEGRILSFRCGGERQPALRIEQAWVNDDYCDCPDGSDETETSACAHLRPAEGTATATAFRCVNSGHISADIPASRVADGICDCCDGTDERRFAGPGGNPCADTCVEVGRSYREQRARDQLLLRQGLRVKGDASKRVAKMQLQRAAELAQLREDLSEIELVRQLIEGRKFTEEAIEFKEQAWRAKHMEALDEDAESKMEAEELAAGSSGGGKADRLIKQSMEEAKRARADAKIKSADAAAASTSSLSAQKTHVWLGPEPDEETKRAHGRALAEEDLTMMAEAEEQYHSQKKDNGEATATTMNIRGNSSNGNDNKWARIPRGELSYRVDQVRNITIAFAPSRLLHGVPNSDIDPAMKAAREAATTKLLVNRAGSSGTAASVKANDGGDLDTSVRTCGLLEFLASPSSDSVTSMEILAAKTRGGASQGIWGFWGISLMDISVGIGGIPPELREGGEDKAARKHRQRKRTRKEMRRHGFMGPIFNGGREGWARGYRYVLSGVGLVFSPVRLLWELTSVVLGAASSVVRFLTPEFIAAPLRKQYARLAKLVWMRVGVKARRLWRRYEGPWAWRAFWNAVPEVYRFYFPRIDEKHVRPEAEALRMADKLVVNEKATLERRIRELESKKTVFYGPGGVFTELSETCVSSSVQGYNYKVCPFKETTQNGGTSLGKWKGFGDYRKDDKTPAAGSVPPEDVGNAGSSSVSLKPYLDWWFTGGTSCYQGPKRKSLVHLKCGPDNLLENVVEPETCLYEMVMRTPAACDEGDLDPAYEDVEKPCWDVDKLGCY